MFNFIISVYKRFWMKYFYWLALLKIGIRGVSFSCFYSREILLSISKNGSSVSDTVLKLYSSIKITKNGHFH